MPFEDAIQLSESIEYPEGKNSITIEGTGDEGGLSTFPRVDLVVTPTSLVANGINVFTCTATVYDPNHPSATVASLRSEATDASTPITIEVGMVIKEFVGLWLSVGGAKGTEITSRVVRVERDKVVLDTNQPLTEAEGRSVIIDYYGNTTVSFDTSAPLITIANETDPDWVLPTVSGDFLPFADIMVDGVYDQPAVVSVQFVPRNGELGFGYITARFGDGFDTEGISVDGSPATVDISVSAEPSSIPPRGESVITAMVSQGGQPVTSGTVSFNIWHNAAYGYLSSRTALIGDKQTEEDVHSTYDFSKLQSTVSLQYPCQTLISIIDANGIDYTNQFSSFGDNGKDRTTLYMAPSFPQYDVLLTVQYIYSGVAIISFFAKDLTTANPTTGQDDPVLISAIYKGLDKLCSVSIAEGGTTGLSITADPDTLPKRTGDLPPHGETKPPDNGESLLTIDGPEGYVDVRITHGEGTLSKTSVLMDRITSFTETVTPSSVTKINVAHRISSISQITHGGENVGSYTFENSEITLNTPLADLEPVIVIYDGTGVAELYYTPPLNWEGEVHVTATQGTLLDSCTIIVGGASDSSNLDISVEAAPEAIAPYSQSTVTATVMRNAPIVGPEVGVTVAFTVANKNSALPAVGGLATATAVTNAEGKASIKYNGVKVTGTDVVTATIVGDKSANCEIRVGDLSTTAKYRYVFEMFNIQFKVLTKDLINAGLVFEQADKNIFETNVTGLPLWIVSNNGPWKSVAPTTFLSYTGPRDSGVDEFGGTDQNPAKYPMCVDVYLPFIPIGYVAYEWEFSTTGCDKVGDSSFKVFDPDQYTSPATKTVVHLAFPMQGKNNDLSTNVPVVLNGGKATPPAGALRGDMNGQTVVNDAKGVLPFTGQPPGVHKLTITPTDPNSGFLPNQPNPDKPNTNYDDDPTNKTVTQAPRSMKQFLLDPTDFGVVGKVKVLSNELHNIPPAAQRVLGYKLVSLEYLQKPATTKTTATP